MKLGLFLLLVSVSAWAQDSAFDPVDNNLTIEEEAASQNYIHEGMAQQSYNEMCFEEDGRMKTICQEGNNRAWDGGTMGTLEILMPAVTKAYALITTVGGGGSFKTLALDDKGKQKYEFEGDGENAKPRVPSTAEQTQIDNGEVKAEKSYEDEDTQDYCGYVAMAGEALNIAYTQVQNAKTEENYQASKPEARQAAAFYSMAENEKTNAKAANMQFYVWGATAGCYTAYLAQAKFRGDWKVPAKLAGSALIATFYKKKAGVHEDREKLLREMAKQLPQAGDCNPFTATSCFCSEPTSPASDPGNFRKYCIADALASRSGDGKNPIPCVDANGKADIECKCKRNNSCIDRRLRMAGVDIGLDPLALRDPLRGISPLANGFESGDLNAAAQRNLAAANRALEEYGVDDLSNINSKQKKEAKALSQFLPKAAAVRLASLKGGGRGSLPGSMNLASLGSNPLAAAADPKKKNTIRRQDHSFKKGGDLGSGSKKSRRSNPLAALRKRKRKQTAKADILNFAQKAEENAAIRQDPGTNIFDVISYRYKMSAWGKFPEAFDGQREDAK